LKKVFIFIFFILILVASFFGIKKFISKKKSIDSLETEFKSVCMIDFLEKKYECEIQNSPNITIIKINSPKNLEGMVFSVEGEKQKVIFKNKEFDKIPIPENSFLSLTAKILRSLNDISNFTQTASKDGFHLKSKKDKNNFELICDSKGKIMEILSPENNLKIKFSG
jgi:hypothetical protein